MIDLTTVWLTSVGLLTISTIYLAARQHALPAIATLYPLFVVAPDHYAVFVAVVAFAGLLAFRVAR